MASQGSGRTHRHLHAHRPDQQSSHMIKFAIRNSHFEISYQSKATFMPLGKSSGGLQAALGKLSGLPPLGRGGGVAKESPAERILAILQSRTLAEDIIQRLEVFPHLFAKKWDAGQQQWRTAQSSTVQDAVRA